MALPPDIFHWNTCPKKYSNSFSCDRTCSQSLCSLRFADMGFAVMSLQGNMWLKWLVSKVDKHHLQYMNFKKLNTLRWAVVWKKHVVVEQHEREIKSVHFGVNYPNVFQGCVCVAL